MNSLKSKRPRSSQLTICVKDLYRPIVRQSASAMKRPCLNPYGFKLLKKSGKSASPLKISISKSNSSCSNNYKPNAKNYSKKTLPRNGRFIFRADSQTRRKLP